jgi:4-diphosphocytidyl-2-C-methyl-D-erythritol kinase
MSSELILPAPAKLNLFLHITGRRGDGYHLLQTVFQLLDYSDEIKLSLREDNQINRIDDFTGASTLKNIPLETDLCIRAAKLLQANTNFQGGVDISLNKKLPIGGGLGGGSSDAATVLQGLNHLWDCKLSNQELATLGLQLGADVPVFVHGQSAWAEGVGELLTPIELEQKWFLVIQPNVSVSTAEIFADQGLTRDCEALTITRFLKGSGSEKLNNVFEPIVTKKYPQIAAAIEWLSSYSPARLTGTGSCIFASFLSEKAARQVLEDLDNSRHNSPQGWLGFVAKGLNQSPVITALKK